MWKERAASVLITGVPKKRSVEGGPRHIEHDDDTAMTDFEVPSGLVRTVHTPQEIFPRVHEIMHSRHSDMARMHEQYDGALEIVAQVVEDCRIHTRFWPWYPRSTPQNILRETRKFMRDEMKGVEKKLKENPKRRGTWPDFATRLRQAAIRIGLGETRKTATRKADFADHSQTVFANRILQLVATNNEGQAAGLIMQAFFPDETPLPSQDSNERSGLKRATMRNGTTAQPPMAIIELPLTEPIPEARRGYRRATSGARLHRPSLRKPVLPQRIFVRKTPRTAGGTILVDASGSMGDFEQVTRWLKKAPFGTIAYYAGNGKSGWLYIYAKNGRRAMEPIAPPSSGNTVDGPALSWLMSQPGPRIMVTDRGFCDVDDSIAQIQRLNQLERTGQVKVVDYAHDDDAPLDEDE